MPDQVRVLLADDDTLVRHALGFFVGEVDGLTVVGEAADGRVAVDMCATLRPDVVLMDMQMPVMDGITATREITTANPATKVLAVTTFSPHRHVVPALRAGASGYLLKDSEPEELVAAIRAVHEGGFVLSKDISGALVEAVRNATDPTPSAPLTTAEALTDRERDVVVLLAEGLTNGEIARRLCVSEATVKTHLGRVMVKWKCRDRVQVLIRAARAGVVRLG